MSEFANVSNEELSATLAAIENLPGTGTMVDALRKEIQYRADNAEIIKARAGNVTTCRALNEGLASVRHNPDPEISDPDGTIVKNARLALVKTLVRTFDVNVARAEKIVLVLMDESGQTDVAGDIEKAAAYVAAHKTSTVYSTTRPDDADKGTHASTDTLNAAMSAGDADKGSDAAKPADAAKSGGK
jgi:hypothetical protein